MALATLAPLWLAAAPAPSPPPPPPIDCCVQALSEAECVSNWDGLALSTRDAWAECDFVAEGEICEGDGELLGTRACVTDNDLDNCADFFDVYRRVACLTVTPSASSASVDPSAADVTTDASVEAATNETLAEAQARADVWTGVGIAFIVLFLLAIGALGVVLWLYLRERRATKTLYKTASSRGSGQNIRASWEFSTLRA